MPRKRIQFNRIALVVRTWLIPAILVVVAMIHMRQWTYQHRSSWGTGAGFGMFATVDYHASRFFRCHGTTEQGDLRIEILRIEMPEEIGKESGLIARVIPSTNNLQDVTKQLSRQTWFVHTEDAGDSYLSTRQSKTDAAPIAVNQIDLEIWGLNFKPKAKQLASFKINETSSIDQEAGHVANR